MVDPNAQALATVLITTKDRKDDLARAIRSVITQTANVELILVDDGSSDGTDEAAADLCPGARVIRNPEPLGIIEARNRAARLASCRVLFTLDDDAEYSDPETIERAVPLFDHPRIGAIAIPLINYIGDEQKKLDFHSSTNEPDFPCLFAYRGGANAKRVDLFLKLGGYGGGGRQGEETSYCIRMLDAGYTVRATGLPPVFHYPAPNRRDRADVVRYGARNTLVFAWEHAPLSRLPLHVGGVLRNQLRIGRREGQIGAAFSGLLAGVGASLKTRRRPVSIDTYRLFRRLVEEGPLTVSEIDRNAREPTKLPPHTENMPCPSNPK